MVLTTREALRALADGKKLRPTHWPKKCYIVLTSDGEIMDNDNYVEDFNSKANYVIWEEASAKHGESKYLYQQPGELYWRESQYYYCSEELFKHDHPGIVNFVRLKGESA